MIESRLWVLFVLWERLATAMLGLRNNDNS